MNLEKFGYVLATKLLVNRKMPVGFMYREKGKNGDSGWRFFAGIETQEYTDQPENIGIYNITTITQIDSSIIPLLDAPAGSAFERKDYGAPLTAVEDFDFAPEGE